MVEQKTIADTGWAGELRETLKLAWPLIISQLAGIALYATDVVMMGWLGRAHLAAGQLAFAIMHPLVIGGIGVVSATAPMIAQAIGARQGRSVRRTVRQGFWVSIVITFVLAPIIWQGEAILNALGQEPEIAALSGSYMRMAVLGIVAGFFIVALRSLLSSRGDTRVILWITVAGVFINGFGNYSLMFGNFGMPRLELVGAGISTSIVNFFMFGLALLYVVFHRRYRRYYILVRLWKADWARFWQVLRLGLPIGVTLVAEIGLFGVAVIMMGWLGTDQVAAHAVAIQCASIAFMVPLGISQATTVRVGLAYGEKNAVGVGRAGWTSMGLSLMFMSATSMLFLIFPYALVALYLDPADPLNATTLTLAASFLGIAAMFQLVDGAQVVASAALRGLSDTRVPMVFAIVGYWLFGLPISYFCGFALEMGGVGIWIGLAAGIAFAAVMLTTRFALRERLGLAAKPISF